MNRPARRLVVLALPLLSIAACAAPASGLQNGPLTPIGCFADVVTDGEHADGYSAQLWSASDAVAGLIAVHRGLIGDPPLGVLESVRHEPSTNRITFTAKLTVGLHSCPIHANVPSQDLLSFDGVLTADALQGGVRLDNHVHDPPAPGDFRQTVMRREPECSLGTHADRDIWHRSLEPVLAARGPRW